MHSAHIDKRDLSYKQAIAHFSVCVGCLFAYLVEYRIITCWTTHIISVAADNNNITWILFDPMAYRMMIYLFQEFFFHSMPQHYTRYTTHTHKLLSLTTSDVLRQFSGNYRSMAPFILFIVFGFCFFGEELRRFSDLGFWINTFFASMGIL